MRKAAIFNVILWVSVILFSCSFDEHDQQVNIQLQAKTTQITEINNLRYKVIKAKTNYLKDGCTEWGLAFEDSSFFKHKFWCFRQCKCR